jgi:hypothetical protein
MNSTSAGKNLAITGAFMQAGLPIGVIWTVMGMTNAFGSLGPSGVGNPAQLSHIIGGVLIASVMGAVISLIGAVLIFVSLLRYSYRAEWFFWFLVIYGGVSLLVPPVGTVIGIIFLVYALTNRTRFFRKTV